MKKIILFLVVVVFSVALFAQVNPPINVRANYTFPYFQGSIKVADSSGFEGKSIFYDKVNVVDTLIWYDNTIVKDTAYLVQDPADGKFYIYCSSDIIIGKSGSSEEVKIIMPLTVLDSAEFYDKVLFRDATRHSDTLFLVNATFTDTVGYIYTTGGTNLYLALKDGGVEQLMYGNDYELHAAENITLYSDSGDVTVFTSEGDASMFTSEGDAYMFTSEGDAYINTALGDAAMWTSKGEASIFTHEGNVNVLADKGDLILRADTTAYLYSVYGSVDIDGDSVLIEGSHFKGNDLTVPGTITVSTVALDKLTSLPMATSVDTLLTVVSDTVKKVGVQAIGDYNFPVLQMDTAKVNDSLMVTGGITAGTNITATGNISATDITATGNVTGDTAKTGVIYNPDGIHLRTAYDTIIIAPTGQMMIGATSYTPFRGALSIGNVIDTSSGSSSSAIIFPDASGAGVATSVYGIARAANTMQHRSDVHNFRTLADVSLFQIKSSKIGVGIENVTYDITFSGQADKQIGMIARTTTGNGFNLTLSSGGCKALETDKNSGNLRATTSTSTGTGYGDVYLATTTNGTTGTASNSATDKMHVLGRLLLDNTQAGTGYDAGSYIDITPGTSGCMGYLMIGDAEEYVWFIATSDAVVTLITNSANVVNTNTDAKFCIVDAGSTVRITNALGASKTMSGFVIYNQ